MMRRGLLRAAGLLVATTLVACAHRSGPLDTVERDGHWRLEGRLAVSDGRDSGSGSVTWEQDGEQYIGLASGYGGAVPLWGGDMAQLTKQVNQGGSFWVFKLPRRAR